MKEEKSDYVEGEGLDHPVDIPRSKPASRSSRLLGLAPSDALAPETSSSSSRGSSFSSTLSSISITLALSLSLKGRGGEGRGKYTGKKAGIGRQE